MPYSIDNPDEFKLLNLSTWKENTQFWLEGKMRHIQDLDGHASGLICNEIERLAPNPGTLIDLGCGEAWMLRKLRQHSPLWRYVGIDFNGSMVDSLKIRHQGDIHAEFVAQDVEAECPAFLVGVADVVVCSFSLFEVPRLANAFCTISSALRQGGRLIIFGIEPLAQLIAISRSWDELFRNLSQYEVYGAELGYDKEIDIGGATNSHIYRGILYSSSDYVTMAMKYRLGLVSSSRIIKTNRIIPQVYESLLFELKLNYAK